MTGKYCLEVQGPYACFTRPEMKVERVSYDVMTPSAARSIFESILWKPQMRWRVLRIEVLKPVRWINLRRNEVSAVISTSNVRQAMNAGRGALGMYIEEERQQRAGYFLRDVAYRVHAQLSLVPGSNDPLVKYTEMFVRRASKGQCVNQPYLGCREFAADVRLVTQDSASVQPIEDTRDLGWMLHDLDFTNASDPQPRFFNAKMNAGVVEVPPFEVAFG
jgi:CRISPR-associated protein Cas5d